ncbi:MAG TPA: MG2 domain-containing protein, partial [Kofleriaceae bacterium]|nr:MG2 domain-containing protein [Kofleriaceae bacterium]
MRTYGLMVLVLLAWGCGAKHSADDLKVTGSPTGAVEGKIHLTIGFSRPMVARDQLNKAVASPPVTLSPALTSEAQWIDDKTLVVWPKVDLPVSTRFVATVPAGTKALDGGELSDAFSFEFFTQRLTASLDVLGPATRAARRQPVRVSFNHDVPLDQVTRHCQFTAAATQVPVANGPESPSGPARGYTIVPAADLAVDTAWKLLCATDLRGSVGNLGLEKPAELAFHTYGPPAFVKLEPSGKDIVPDEDVRLSIQFTNALKPPYQMKLTPKVTGFPEHCHALDDDKPGLACAVSLEPQTTYTLAIDASQRDEFDQPLGKPQSLTFHTTDARPSVSMDSGYFVAELKRPVVPVWTRNVQKLQVTAVPITPANFHQLRPLLDWWEEKPADFGKTRLQPKRKQIAVAGTRNKWGQHALSAAELFGGTPGPGMFYLEVGSSEVTAKPFADGGRQKVLVNFTDIGVVTKLSGSRGLVWATRLSTGKPLPGAAVSVRDGAGKITWSGTTDDDGVAVLPGSSQLAPVAGKRGGDAGLDTAGEHYAPEREGDLSTLRIYVQDGADWTMVNPTSSNGLAAWNYNVSVDSDPSPVKLRGFMHTDRGLYRPGEKVHVKGLARTTRLGAPLESPGEGKKIKVTVDGPNGKTFVETTAKTSAFGGFWFDLDLPGDARLGDYVIHARLDSGTFTRDFLVEEYRPATYEVTGKLKDARIVASGTVHGTVSANYFYGAPVRGGKLALTVHSRSRRVQFTGLDEFDFVDGRRYDGYRDELESAQNLVTEDSAQLDDKGNAAVAIAVGPNDVAYDADLLIDASVTAPSNEVIAKTFTVPYFHARTYFGIKLPGYFADVGKSQTIQIVAVTPDGKPASGPAKVTITRRDWNCVWEDWGYRGNYQCKDTTKTLLTRTLQLAGKPAELAFTPPAGGDYWIVVEGENDKQGAAPAARELYAWGDGGGSWRSSDSMALEIVADKKQYKAGDTATLLLKTDLAEATGLVTIERDGVLESRPITLTPKVK